MPQNLLSFPRWLAYPVKSLLRRSWMAPMRRCMSAKMGKYWQRRAHDGLLLVMIISDSHCGYPSMRKSCACLVRAGITGNGGAVVFNVATVCQSAGSAYLMCLGGGQFAPSAAT